MNRIAPYWFSTARHDLGSRRSPFRRNGRDWSTRYRAIHPAAPVSRDSILPCRWSHAGRTSASPPPTETGVGGLCSRRASSPRRLRHRRTTTYATSYAGSSGPLMRFCAPSTLEVSKSDCHPVWMSPSSPATRRACPTRLRCTFRLSQPLGALFLPKPFELISSRNALGVSLSKISPAR